MGMLAQQGRQLVAQLIRKPRAFGRMRHGRDAQFALRGVIKGRRHDQAAAPGETIHAAQAVKKIKAAAGGQGGRGADGGADLAPQVPGQHLGRRHRAGASPSVRRSAGSIFGPLDPFGPRNPVMGGPGIE